MIKWMKKIRKKRKSKPINRTISKAISRNDIFNRLFVITVCFFVNKIETLGCCKIIEIGIQLGLRSQNHMVERSHKSICESSET